MTFCHFMTFSHSHPITMTIVYNSTIEVPGLTKAYVPLLGLRSNLRDKPVEILICFYGLWRQCGNAIEIETPQQGPCTW